MKVSADRELCIQAGNCVMVAGDVFDQDDEGIVVILQEEVADEQAARAAEAVKLCPATALRLDDR
ncbi:MULTISPECIES: ferredoxin [Mycolicibacterium]|uniref:Ferredoxin n=2 Tax=Mycolicibacterium gilvum TaxID=1804 RepID=E6TNU3_MYCSR|nr:MULTISPECIES: ferredoxin [Mycolicibacterium]ADT97260.1 ferredoxin [Mycolicibacterium gilvum Spyr1]MBV5245280.1 ferredoxin [Mycolicibacterium sp. PAM1]MCV7054173.1 ferredoxin [Mycolicibacterium gilvum]STZ41365.1 ferredoxin [Mycolicibacterium gilvum]